MEQDQQLDIMTLSTMISRVVAKNDWVARVRALDVQYLLI